MGSANSHCLSLAVLCLVAFLPCLTVVAQPALQPQRAAERKAMGRVKPLVESWLAAAAESQQIANELLEDPEHRVQADFVAVKIAHLRGEPTTAIAILDRVIKQAKKEKAPGYNVSAWVVADLWRGTIARHHGDFRVARESYERLLAARLAGEEAGSMVQVIANLYLAEIGVAMEGSAGEILQRLEAVHNVPVPKPDDMKMLHTFYTDWATYLHVRVKDGNAAAQKTLVGSQERMGMSFMLALHHLGLTGIAIDPREFSSAKGSMQRSLTLAVQNRVSPMDRSMASLALGFLAQQEKQLDDAAKHYRQLFLSDGFLAPDGGVSLLMLLDNQGKAEEANALATSLLKRFPKYKGLLADVRKGR